MTPTRPDTARRPSVTASGWAAASAISFLSLTLALTLAARAQVEDTSTITLDGVEVAGQSAFSSTSEPREPQVLLMNSSSEPRTVVFTALHGLLESERHPLTLLEPRSFTLAPGESRTVYVEFDGTAPRRGGGLGSHLFAIGVRVGRARGEVRAVTGYVCRIPLRR